MATLRSKRKLAAVSRETPENTRCNQSRNTLNPGMAEEFITEISEEIEGRVTKKLSQEFRRRESRILVALSTLDEHLLKPQVRICSVASPGTSRKNNSEDREPTGDRYLNDPCLEVVFSACHTSKLNDSEQEETHHCYYEKQVLFNKSIRGYSRVLDSLSGRGPKVICRREMKSSSSYKGNLGKK